MQEQGLPKGCKGYSTEELLDLLERRMSGQSLEGVPKDLGNGTPG